MAEGDTPESTPKDLVKKALGAREDLEKRTGKSWEQLTEERAKNPKVSLLPGTEMKFVPERFSVGGSDAEKAAPETTTETNSTKPVNDPQESPRPNWRAKLIQDNQGKATPKV